MTEGGRDPVKVPGASLTSSKLCVRGLSKNPVVTWPSGRPVLLTSSCALDTTEVHYTRAFEIICVPLFYSNSSKDLFSLCSKTCPGRESLDCTVRRQIEIRSRRSLIFYPIEFPSLTLVVCLWLLSLGLHLCLMDSCLYLVEMAWQSCVLRRAAQVKGQCSVRVTGKPLSAGSSSDPTQPQIPAVGAAQVHVTLGDGRSAPGTSPAIQCRCVC